MSLQVGYEDLPCETVHCTPLGWSQCAAGVTVPCTSLGGPILIKNIEPRIPPKFPILILNLKLVHPIDRNEARLGSMAPLLEILEVVDTTMIDDVNGDGDTMVFNTKRGVVVRGKKREGCIPVPLYHVRRVWPSFRSSPHSAQRCLQPRQHTHRVWDFS